MPQDRDRLLDHALVEHGHEGLVEAREPAVGHDREIGGLVRVKVKVDGVDGLVHWQHLIILPCR